MANIACHIVIVGCGLGGLAAAIALKRQGHDVTMLEQAARLSEVKTVPSPSLLTSFPFLPLTRERAVIAESR